MTQEFDFEKFERGVTPLPGAPTMSIHTRGTFAFNQRSYEMLGSPSHVELLFDRDRRAIGVRAADPEDRDAYQLRKQNRSQNYIAGGPAFCNKYGIPLGRGARQYRPEMHGDVLVVSLGQEPEEASVATEEAKAE